MISLWLRCRLLGLKLLFEFKVWLLPDVRLWMPFASSKFTGWEEEVSFRILVSLNCGCCCCWWLPPFKTVIRSEASSIHIPYNSNDPVLYISDNNGSKAIRMTAETITAAVASGTSGVMTLMYSPSIAATSTAMLRTESANTWVYVEHFSHE